MKLFFFLVAFSLIFFRFYLGYTHSMHNSNESGSMVIESDGFTEKIGWSGKIKISDDDQSVVSVSPGGYLKYQLNGKKMLVESNVKGVLSYDLYDGYHQLPLDDSGRRLVSEGIRELINAGYDAEGRRDRVYKNRGADGLLQQIPLLKTEPQQIQYLNKLFSTDTLSADQKLQMIVAVDKISSDADKGRLLAKVTADDLKDTAFARVFFRVVSRLNGDAEKMTLIKRFLSSGDSSVSNLERLLAMVGDLDVDVDKYQVLAGLIKGKRIPENYYDTTLRLIQSLNVEVQRRQLYLQLLNQQPLSDSGWSVLLRASTSLTDDQEKVGLLLQIAQQMPLHPALKADYMLAAKSIKDDGEYGKAIRALDDATAKRP